MTLKSRETTTFIVKAGYVITITPTGATNGSLVERFLLDGSSEKTAVIADAVTLGPFLSDYRMRLSCTDGTLAWAVAPDEGGPAEGYTGDIAVGITTLTFTDGLLTAYDDGVP